MQPDRPRHLLLADAVRLFAGAERFLLDAATGLAGRGYRVTLQAYPGSPLAERALSAGIEVHGVRTRADGAPWTVGPLLGWLVSHEVDAILTNYDKDLRTVGWAARLCRRPIAVLHSRECDVPLKNLPHYRFFYNRIAHEVLTNSEATRRTTLASAPWLQKNRVHVLPKGVDLERFAEADGAAFRSRISVDSGETLIGFAGQFVPRKRCAHLLRTLASPDFAALEWTLALAGSGPEEEDLRRMASDLGLGGRIRFCGQLEDIAPFMAAIDLLALPSLVEGFGYVVAEAAAAGVPSVAYAASSLPELVRDGQTGLLADPEREGSYAEALGRLLTDAELRGRTGETARQNATQAFGMETMLDRLEERIVRCYQAVRGSYAPPHTQEADA